MKKSLLSFACLWILAVASSRQDTAHIKVDLGREIMPMKPIWAWFGYDEPNYTYMKDGKKLLSEIAELSPVPVYVRTHSLLVTGDGSPALKWGSTNAYTEDANGKPVYNWRIIDSIFDTYISRGMRPLAQIGFMPEALSVKPDPYRHYWKPGDPYNDIYTGWAYPPKDYHKWAELVYQWVKHSVERYGKKEVENWYWELWNEPDIPYWKGTLQEFFKLYDFTADAVKRALPTAKIGGPDVTGGGMKFLDAFIKHCLYDTNYVTGKIGSPLELVSFHAKGSPRVVNGKVVMGIRNQLKNIEDNFKVIAAYLELRNVPIIIGESDPEGCAACGMKTNPQNAYRNGTMYSSYTAASFARKYELARMYRANLAGAVTWAFEFEDQPWFYGFRDLATNGVDKPVLNVFRMFGKMSGNLVEAGSDKMYPLKDVLDSGIRKPQTDIGVLASRNKHEAAILLWNYHDVDDTGVPASVKLMVKGINASSVAVTTYLVDTDNNNSYQAWKKMGSPQEPDAAQVQQLLQAARLRSVAGKKKTLLTKNTWEKNIELQRQGVMLVVLSWK